MELSKETSEKIGELQVLERNEQALLAQKQSVQIELNEVSNALQEVKTTKDEVYKTIAGVMLKVGKDAMLKELEEKKKILEMKLSSVEKQEKLIEERSEKLKNEINSSLKNNNKKKE
jgi:prefoldin beta subunit